MHQWYNIALPIYMHMYRGDVHGGSKQVAVLECCCKFCK